MCVREREMNEQVYETDNDRMIRKEREFDETVRDHYLAYFNIITDVRTQEGREILLNEKINILKKCAYELDVATSAVDAATGQGVIERARAPKSIELAHRGLMHATESKLSADNNVNLAGDDADINQLMKLAKEADNLLKIRTQILDAAKSAVFTPDRLIIATTIIKNDKKDKKNQAKHIVKVIERAIVKWKRANGKNGGKIEQNLKRKKEAIKNHEYLDIIKGSVKHRRVDALRYVSNDVLEDAWKLTMTDEIVRQNIVDAEMVTSAEFSRAQMKLTGVDQRRKHVIIDAKNGNKIFF